MAMPELTAVQQYLKEHDWVDMEVYSAGSRSDLVIAMAQNLTYYHQAALVFSEPSYFSGPFSWTTMSAAGLSDEDQVLRVLSAAERDALMVTEAEAGRAEGFLFEIRTDEDTTVRIGAAGVSLDPTMVFYYRREDLEPGQRLAYWVD